MVRAVDRGTGRAGRLVLGSLLIVVAGLSLVSGPASAAAPFKPCFVNSGSVASMGPCGGPIGTVITIRTSRKLPSPVAKVWFYEISSHASIGGTICFSCATVSVSLAGNGNLAGGGTAPGSYYQFKAPSQLCLNGSNQGWAAFLIPTTPQGKYGYGQVGTFTIYSCPAAPAAGGAAGHPACAAGAPNTIQISPKSIAAGGIVDLLYACGTKLNFANVSGAPQTIAMYTMASFRKLHYVNARFTGAPGVPAPVFPKYRVAGADDVKVTIPVGLAPGQYAFVVHNRFTDVAWAFLTVT
jgi:hypothetical protein